MGKKKLTPEEAEKFLNALNEKIAPALKEIEVIKNMSSEELKNLPTNKSKGKKQKK